MARIKVKISKDGSKTEIQVEGVQGQSCTSLTAKMQEALGVVEKQDLTQEFHETEASRDINIDQN